MSSSETKLCPHCDEEIRAAAKKCRYCGERVDDDNDDGDDEPVRRRPRKKYVPGTTERMLVPVGRPLSAIAAGYFALFGILPFVGLPFSIAALICGIVALKSIKKNPDLSGSGRAWFGIILGGLMTVISVLLVILVVIAVISEQGRRRF